MPRQRKTQSGDPALAVPSTPGVRYGEGQPLQDMARALPTPNARASAPQASGATPTPPPSDGVVTPSPGVAPVALPQPGLLLAPSARPAEPVTTGLNRGLGAGPEALGMNPIESPTGRFLRQLTQMTGRDQFAELARRNGL